MEFPLEFHSLKPANEIAGLYGFGCADYNPDQCFSAGWGFYVSHFYYTYSPYERPWENACVSYPEYVY
jgi:hypothetical protein